MGHLSYTLPEGKKFFVDLEAECLEIDQIAGFWLVLREKLDEINHKHPLSSRADIRRFITKYEPKTTYSEDGLKPTGQQLRLNIRWFDEHIINRGYFTSLDSTISKGSKEYILG